MSTLTPDQIRSRLIGQQIGILYFDRYEGTTFRTRGTIDDIIPGKHINVTLQDGKSAVIAFCGIMEGIVEISMGNGGIIFNNPGVPAEYAQPVGMHKGRVDYGDTINLPAQIEAAYEPLRAQGVWHLD